LTESADEIHRLPTDFSSIASASGIKVEIQELDESALFIEADLEKFSVVLYANSTKSIHRSELNAYLTSKKTETRFYRTLDVSGPLFSKCFNIRQDELKLLNARIIASARSARTITVISGMGAKLIIEIDSLADWTSSFGWFDGDNPGILPPGEVNTFSERVNGRFVASGAINANFKVEADVRLADNNIILNVENGVIESMEVDNEYLKKMCDSLYKIENGRKIGEIGFGSNEGIFDFVPFRSHINERVAGFHLGCGSPIQKNGYVRWTCPLHIDFISQAVDIYFDDRLVFSHGRWEQTKLSAEIDGFKPDLYVDTI
jgi:aminopeptidase